MPLRAALLSALHTQPAAPAPAAAARPRRRSSTAASPIDGRRSRIDTPRRRLPAAAAAGGTGGGTGAVLLLPGFLYGSRQYEGLAADLRTKGFHAEIVPASLSDWLPIITGGSFDWYLERLDAALCDMHARHGRVALVGHSAGGWIARILLGGERYQGVRYGRSGMVHTLLTLGTPHQSIENYPFGRTEESLVGEHLSGVPPEVAGSSLKFANHFYPTADSLGGVRVVCACGDAIRGRPLWGGGSGSSSADEGGSGNGHKFAASYFSTGSCSLDDGSLDDGGGVAVAGSCVKASRYDAWLAYNAYMSGCGRGDVDGDGVTPLCISQLPGAEQLILPGVWHYPRRKASQLWYGDAAVQELWQQYLLEPQAQTRAAPAGRSA